MWERWSDRAWLGTVVPVYSMDVRRSTYVARRIFRAFEKQDHFAPYDLPEAARASSNVRGGWIIHE